MASRWSKRNILYCPDYWHKKEIFRKEVQHFNLRQVFAIKPASRQGGHREKERTVWVFCSAIRMSFLPWSHSLMIFSIGKDRANDNRFYGFLPDRRGKQLLQWLNCLHGNYRQLWHPFLHKGKKFGGDGIDPAVASHGGSKSLGHASWMQCGQEETQNLLKSVSGASKFCPFGWYR